MPPAASQTQTQTLSTEERGARTINETLLKESRYPDLDSYLSREFPFPSSFVESKANMTRA
jgi:nuclear pore complex protein Nup155